MAPWSGFWDRNLFVDVMPAIGPFVASPFVKGAVSGVGVVTVIAGLVELAALVMSRQRPKAGTPPAGS